MIDFRHPFEMRSNILLVFDQNPPTILYQGGNEALHLFGNGFKLLLRESQDAYRHEHKTGEKFLHSDKSIVSNVTSQKFTSKFLDAKVTKVDGALFS